MAKYRKKPVVIEAEVYKPGMEDGFEPHREKCEPGCQDSCYYCPNYKPYIDTLEGKHYISPGDYIITGVENERYPCKPSVFAKTYEPAEEANNNSLDGIINICEKLLPFVDDGLSVHIEKIWELAKDAKE